MKKKVVLVNDSRFENLILNDMLNQLGYDVEIASEYDAVYEVEKFDPDLVIVNYIMQEVKGDALIAKIKASNPYVKCLLSSNSGIHKEDFKVPIEGILRTPVSMFTLKDLLSRIDAPIAVQPTEKPYLSKTTIQLRFCPGCDEDITIFGETITFCPYCGEGLH